MWRNYINKTKDTTEDGTIYLGTVYSSTLRSQETDTVTLEPYPLNTLKLRKAASVSIFLKKTDGTLYDGEVTVRTSVYRNDEYVDGTCNNGKGLTVDSVPGEIHYGN